MSMFYVNNLHGSSLQVLGSMLITIKLIMLKHFNMKTVRLNQFLFCRGNCTSGNGWRPSVTAAEGEKMKALAMCPWVWAASKRAHQSKEEQKRAGEWLIENNTASCSLAAESNFSHRLKTWGRIQWNVIVEWINVKGGCGMDKLVSTYTSSNNRKETEVLVPGPWRCQVSASQDGNRGFSVKRKMLQSQLFLLFEEHHPPM